MRKHTKGPWVLNTGMVQSKKGSPIAKMFRDNSDFDGVPYIPPTERDANARLIAAAPEMLEFIKMVLKETDDATWITKANAILFKVNGE